MSPNIDAQTSLDDPFGEQTAFGLDVLSVPI
jgi:hypothetical protein